MTVLEYITYAPQVALETDRKACINIMLDHSIGQMPVYKNNILWGTVELDECIHSQEDTIETLTETGYARVTPNAHIFESLSVFQTTNKDVCAVTNENNEWIGILSKTDVLGAFQNSVTAEQLGATLLIECSAKQYSSGQIARIVEGEDAQITGLWMYSIPESGRIKVSLKINTQNAERIVQGLQRFEYDVVYTFGDIDYSENVEKRFQSLMKYIDI